MKDILKNLDNQLSDIARAIESGTGVAEDDWLNALLHISEALHELAALEAKGD